MFYPFLSVFVVYIGGNSKQCDEGRLWFLNFLLQNMRKIQVAAQLFRSNAHQLNYLVYQTRITIAQGGAKNIYYTPNWRADKKWRRMAILGAEILFLKRPHSRDPLVSTIGDQGMGKFQFLCVRSCTYHHVVCRLLK